MNKLASHPHVVLRIGRDLSTAEIPLPGEQRVRAPRRAPQTVEQKLRKEDSQDLAMKNSGKSAHLDDRRLLET